MRIQWSLIYAANIEHLLYARLHARHQDPAVSTTDHLCPWRATVLGDKVDMKGDV